MRLQRLRVFATLMWIAALAASPAAAEYVSFYSYGDGSDAEGQPNYYGAAPAGPYAQMASMQGALPDPALGLGPAGPQPEPPIMDGYGDPGMGFESGYGCDECGGYGGDCPSCGGWGNGQLGGGGMGFGHLMAGLGQCGPYENGECGPRWFDVHAEALYWKRDNISRPVDFTSDGVAGNAPPFVVLSTRSLDFDEEPGFRVTVRFEVGAISAIEVGYFAIFDMTAEAHATSDLDNLFSVFSDFGNPPFFPGFAETDQATFHSIRYRTDLQNAEINWRRQWVSVGGRLHGSTLAGARYLRLTESLRHITRADTGAMDYYVGTENNLYGFQIGGDIWACTLPGLMIGGEAEVGVFGVQAKQNTKINASSLTDPLLEEAQGDDVAMVAEGGPLVIWQVTPRWTARAGYQFLYVDGVALAPENFNTRAPFVSSPGLPRRVKVNHNGAALYHGATAGFEYIW